MKILWIVIMAILLVSCSEERTRALKKAKKSDVFADSEAEKVLQLQEEYFESAVSINPFLTSEEQELFKAFSAKVFALDLSAIFYSPPHSKAIVDGSVVKEGDTIGNKVLYGIDPARIILKEDTREYVLRLKGIRSIER